MEVISSKPVVFKEFSITLTVTTLEESQMLYSIFNHAHIGGGGLNKVRGLEAIAEKICRIIEEEVKE